MNATRPYHETIISLIASINSVEEAARIALFIRSTAIPANHDAVIAAWEQLLHQLKLTDDTLFGVVSFLKAQKAATEAARNGEEIFGCVAGH